MHLKTLALACLVVALAACSSQPRQSAAGTASAATASAPAAPASPPATALVQSASPAQGTPAATPAVSTEPDAAQINRTLLSAGYKPKTVNGELFYCRKEDVTNTAFKKTVCLNQAQIKDQERKIRELQREMIRSQPNPSCIGPTCAGG